MRWMAAVAAVLGGCAQVVGIEDPKPGEASSPDAGVPAEPDARSEDCTTGPVAVHRSDPPIAFLVDRTASMETPLTGGPSRWASVTGEIGDLAPRFHDLVPFAASWFAQTAASPCLDMYGLAPALHNGDAIVALLASQAPDGYNGQFGAAISLQRQALAGSGVIVLFTDSTPSACDGVSDGLTEARDAAALALAGGATVHVIGLGTEAPEPAIAEIAAAGGGLARRATDLGQLEAALAEIAATAITCDFATEPPIDTLDAARLSVRWDGAALDHDDPDGWRVVGDRLVLSGAACETFYARTAGMHLTIERTCP